MTDPICDCGGFEQEGAFVHAETCTRPLSDAALDRVHGLNPVPPDPPTLPSLRGTELTRRGGISKFDFRPTPGIPTEPAVRVVDGFKGEAAPHPVPTWMDVYLAARERHPNAAVWAPAIGVERHIEAFLLDLIARSHAGEFPSKTPYGHIEGEIVVFISMGKRRFELHLLEIES